MEITGFNGFPYESSNEDDISINYNNKERRTWTKTFNTVVMECYFLSIPVDEEGKLTRRLGEECIISGRNDMAQN